MFLRKTEIIPLNRKLSCSKIGKPANSVKWQPSPNLLKIKVIFLIIQQMCSEIIFMSYNGPNVRRGLGRQ